jgi:CRP-like cAMP-binding protein
MSAKRSSILAEDPELAERLGVERRREALHDCLVPVIHVRTGRWSPETQAPHMSYGIGLLVLEGLLTRRVGLDGRFGAELLGNGDLLRPWQHEDNGTTLPHTRDWRVLRPCRIAVLDGDFAVRLARYPEITAALFGRAVRRSRQLAVNMAIIHQPRTDLRLQMLFWELADRWGTVRGDGVHLPMRLTHAMLAELVAATRPTVTKALSELADSGAVRWMGESWLLAGNPPVELEAVGSVSLLGERSDESERSTSA